MRITNGRAAVSGLSCKPCWHIASRCGLVATLPGDVRPTSAAAAKNQPRLHFLKMGTFVRLSDDHWPPPIRESLDLCLGYQLIKRGNDAASQSVPVIVESALGQG